MAQIGAKLRSAEGGLLMFFCLGCHEFHHVRVIGRDAWRYNGNADAPTFTPSVLVTSGHYNKEHDGKSCWCTYNAANKMKVPFKCHRCHSFVENGRIQFLGDCTHGLAGQTVDLPDLPA